MATAERKLGPLTWPAAVEAWKYSTRVAVRSYETFVWVYREIKAYRCVDRVITKLVLGRNKVISNPVLSRGAVSL